MRKSQRVDTIMKRDREDDISNPSTTRSIFNKKRKANAVAIPIAIPGQHNTSRIAGMHTSQQSSTCYRNRGSINGPLTTVLNRSDPLSTVREQSTYTQSTSAISSNSSTTILKNEQIKKRRLRRREVDSPSTNRLQQRSAAKEVIEIDDSDEDNNNDEEVDDEIMLVKEPTVVIPIEGNRKSVDTSSSAINKFKSSSDILPSYSPISNTTTSADSDAAANDKQTKPISNAKSSNNDIISAMAKMTGPKQSTIFTKFSSTTKKEKAVLLQQQKQKQKPQSSNIITSNSDSNSVKLNAGNQLYAPAKRNSTRQSSFEASHVQLSQNNTEKIIGNELHQPSLQLPRANNAVKRQTFFANTKINSNAISAASLASKAVAGGVSKESDYSLCLSPSPLTGPLSLEQSSSLILQNRPSSYTSKPSLGSENSKSTTAAAHTAQQNSVPEYTSNMYKKFLNQKRSRSSLQDDDVASALKKTNELLLRSRTFKKNLTDSKIAYSTNAVSSKKYKIASSSTIEHSRSHEVSLKRQKVKSDRLSSAIGTSSLSLPSVEVAAESGNDRKKDVNNMQSNKEEEEITSDSSDKGYSTAPPSPQSVKASPPRSLSPPTRSKISKIQVKRIEYDPIDDYKIEPIGADEHYLSYPFTKKKAITVFECDYERLNEDNYLNDTLIDIFPKIWHDDYPQNSDDIHTFSSFFFTKLHTRYGQIDYDKVRRWTSELDIFKKRLLVVPINQNNHWFLIVVLNPGYCIRSKKESTDCIAVEMDENHNERTTTIAKSAHRKYLTAGQPLDRRKPYILTLDPLSLNKQATARAVCTYLKLEAKSKLGLDVEDFLEPQYVMVSCPGQKNYTDCGVFCLHYIEALYARTDRMIEALYENPRKYSEVWDEEGTLMFFREQLKRILKRKMQKYRDYLLQSMSAET